ncbi:MAG: hypothetical protein ABW252_09045 [Polyangiales bacterium]
MSRTHAEDRLRPTRTPQVPSFRTLFQEQVGFVWRVLQRDGVSERELENACEEVFLAAGHEVADAAEYQSVRAWVGSIAARVAATPRAQGVRERELLRPLSSEPYETDTQPPRAPKRARMFASGPSVEARARMLAQLESSLDGPEAARFSEAPSGVARLWVLRLALGVSVLLGGAMLQLQDGCGHRDDDSTARARAALAIRVD